MWQKEEYDTAICTLKKPKVNCLFDRVPSKLVLLVFFLVFLALGVSLYQDYGISWDEPVQRRYGQAVFDYVRLGSPDLSEDPERYYGPIFELGLVGAEHLLGLEDVRSVYFLRHLMTFSLFFLGVFFFFLLCRSLFGSWKLGLLGAFCLILSPRVFAHAFYNSKDIPFMVLFIISGWTLLVFLDRKTLPTAFGHAVACSLLIGVRVLGVFVPVMTASFFLIDLLLRAKRSLRPFLVLGIYLLCVSLLTILIWPTLWTDPLGQFLAAFRQMSHYPWEGDVLYFGAYIKSVALPWHYIFVWVGLTTPLVYLFFFGLGLLSTLKKVGSSPLQFYQSSKGLLYVGAWLLLPILSILVLRSVLYDGWRQVFFLYPAFLILGLAGVRQVLIWQQECSGKITSSIALGILILSFVYLGSIPVSMIRSHPYQNVYFNRLAGRMSHVAQQFEMDYWGLAYRRGLEQVLQQDPSPKIPILAANFPGIANSYLLPASERERLIFVQDPKDAKYFITNFRWQKTPYNLPEFYSVKVRDTAIVTVYRLKSE